MVKVRDLVGGFFPLNSRMKWLLLNVHLAFDCAGSRKVEVAHLGWIWAGLFSCKFTCNKIPL